MMTYQEWLKIVEGSEAMRTVGKRFGLDDHMLRKGIEALMPAAFMGAFPASSPFGNSVPNPFQSVFESDEAKKALARQAELLSGMNKTVLEDMMPAMATAIADVMGKLSSADTARIDDGPAQDMGAAIGGMMAAMMGLSPEKEKVPDPALAEQGMEMFQTWIKAGQTAQTDYLKAMQAVMGKGSETD
jgi:hypothetical protein